MSTKVPQNTTDQEVDLAQISQKLNSFFQRVSTAIFRGIQFFVVNRVLILVLLVIGFGLGFLLDKTQKTYEHEIIVAPNFNSTDYLYAKIDLINSKIKEQDTLFLKNIVGIQEPKNLKKIEIQPIVDVYNFIKNKPENFELIKLMAEDGDVKKILEENMTSKNYMYQSIVLLTKNRSSEEKLIKPLLAYFNSSDYYAKIQKEVYKNVLFKMSQNDSIIKQIDGVLNNFSNSTSGIHKNDKLLYYNENTQLNDIIKTKENLVLEQGAHKVDLIGYDKIIKENTVILNKEPVKNLNNLKFILPILLIILFCLFSSLRLFYRKQKELNGV